MKLRSTYFPSLPLAFASAILLTASTASAITFYWDGITSGTWNSRLNWSTAPGATTPDPLSLPFSEDDAVFNITGANGAQTITLNNDQLIRSMSFNSTGSTNLTGGGTAHTLTLGMGGITMAANAGAVTWGNGAANNDVSFRLGTGAQTWTNNSAAAFTINNTAATFTREPGATLTFNKLSTGNFAIDTTSQPLTNSIIGPWAFFGTGSNQKYATITTGSIAAFGTDTNVTNVNDMTNALVNYEYLTGSSTSGKATTANTVRTSENLEISLYNNTQNFSYDFTVNGILAVGTGNFLISRDQPGTANGHVVIGNTGELVIAGQQAVNISAPIRDGIQTSSLVYSGSNILTLSGTNTYTDGTYLNSGTVRVGMNNNLGSSSGGLTFNGGTLQITGINTLTSFGAAVASGGMAGRTIAFTSGATVGLNITNAATTFTVDKILNQGSGGFTKLGAGTAILNKTNTYTGATTVSQGRLLIDGNISTSTLTTVASAATLGGGGTVGSLTVASGGHVTPGNNLGILKVNGNYIQAGEYMAEVAGIQSGTGYDQISVTGAVNITGGSLVTIFSGTGYALGNQFFILRNDGTDAITGTYAGLAQGATVTTYDGLSWRISYTADSLTNTFTGGNDIALLAVPEPSTTALLGGLGMFALLRRRR